MHGGSGVAAAGRCAAGAHAGAMAGVGAVRCTASRFFLVSGRDDQVDVRVVVEPARVGVQHGDGAGCALQLTVIVGELIQRAEEQKSEHQKRKSTSYAVLCFKKKNK